jgi:uncharacterized membrane protein (DUF2068 family)
METDKRAPPVRRLGLELIAVFKFIKAAALVGTGLAALGLLSPSVEAAVQLWLEGLALGRGRRLASTLAAHAVSLLNLAAPTRLLEIAVGAFLYAALFLVEGVGLARGRRWAEFLTVSVTSSFLPFEVVSLAHRWTLPRCGTLLLNVVAVSYLVWQIRAGSPSHDHAPAEAAAS